jgi:hypothetical protein
MLAYYAEFVKVLEQELELLHPVSLPNGKPNRRVCTPAPESASDTSLAIENHR